MTSVMPNDPGTNSSSSETSSGKGDDVDDGSADETNGTLTAETDDFTDTDHGTDDSSYSASSDKGGVAAPPMLGGVPGLTYTRLVLMMGYWGVPQTFAGGYGGPITGTGTASASTDDTEDDFDSGDTTLANGKTNTDEGFDDTDTWTESAGLNNTSSGSSGGGSYSSTVSDTETGNGTDTDGGSIDGGVTTDGYTDTDTITDTVNNSTSFTSSSSGDGVTYTTYGTNGYTGKNVETDTESGDTTSAAPGTTPPAVTPDNPNGDATSDQSIDDTDTMNSTRTQTYGGTISGPDVSLSGNGDYTAKETLAVNSGSTVDVNVAQGQDVQSGSYSSDASEDQVSNYNETGSQKGQYMDRSWTFGSHQHHFGTNDDGGNFGSGGTDTDALTSGGDSSQSQTVITTLHYLGPNGPSSTMVQTGGGSGSGGSGWTETGAAPGAPVDGDAGSAPAGHDEYIPPADLEGESFNARLNAGNEHRDWTNWVPGVLVDGPIQWGKRTLSGAVSALKAFREHPLDTIGGAITSGATGALNAGKGLLNGKLIGNAIIDYHTTPTLRGAGAKFGALVTEVGASYVGGRVAGAIIGRTAAAAKAAKVADDLAPVATDGAAEAAAIEAVEGEGGALATGASPGAVSAIPERVRSTLETVRKTGAPPSGYQGGRTFMNDGRGGGQVLPRTTADGRAITYREYDVNQYTRGVNRGPERLVIGSDGSAYFTSDHYGSFMEVP